MSCAYPFVAAMAVLLLPCPQATADDGRDKPDDAKKSQGVPGNPAEAKTKPGVTPAPAPSPEQLKGLLRDALGMVQALADAAAKRERSLEMPDPTAFMMRFTKDAQADVVRAIGRAQARLGDLPAARAAWQSAIDAVGEISSFEVSNDRASILIRIAEAQLEAGEKDEARFTLRQASQSVRAIKAESGMMFNLLGPPGMDFSSDPLAKKSDLLRRVAQLHARMGEKEAADTATRQAVETAESLANPRNRIRALLELAREIGAEAARPLWAEALDLALKMTDDYSRAKALEVVFRARIKADQADEAVATIADRLKGDAQYYLLWAVADAIATSDRPVSSRTMDRLCELATKAEFDRASKKIKVFQRIAEAQARLGDYEGAYKSAGAPHPVNDIQNARATQARINVMAAVAAAQIRAKHPEAAKETILTAMEVIAPMPDEDAEAYFPLARFGELQAEAGDLANAIRTAEVLSLSWSKVPIFAKVAVAYARDDRREDARKMIRRGFEAAGRSPNDTLWRLQSQNDADGFGRDLDPMYPAVQVLAKAQAEIGDLDDALKTVGEMNTSQFAGISRYNTIEEIASARLEAGDRAGALRAVDLILPSDRMFQDEKANLLERIARQQAEKDNPAAILDWAGKQATPAGKLQLLRGLADGIAARCAAKAKEARPAEPAAQPKPATR
jgi:hypothetical protein